MSVLRNTLLLLLFSMQISQSQIYTFDHLGIEDGMSQNQVNAVCKDDYGFMWFGTWDGLNRYDGYSFKVFKHRAFDTSSLSSNFISCILNDSDGNLWIGTNGGGLNLFRPEDESFLNLKFNPLKENSISNNGINSIYQDRKNRIWVATEFGLNMIRLPKGKSYPEIHQFFFQNPVLRTGSNFISSIVEFKPDHFIIGTDKGLIHLRFEELNAFSFRLINDPALLSDNEPVQISSLFTDSLGQLWVGTHNSLLINENAKALSEKEAIELVEIKSEGREFDNGIQFINQDSEGQIWIATMDGQLLLSKNSEKPQFNPIMEENYSRVRQEVMAYTTFYQSSDEKILWIGTDIDGVKKLTPSGKNFENIAYKGNKKDGLVNSAVFSVYVDSYNNTWIGTRKGLSIKENGSQKFHNYVRTKGLLDKISNSKIRAFEEDHLGNIWIGTIDGLCRIDWSKGDPSGLEKYPISFYGKSNEKKKGLKTNYIADIHLDHNNILWIATNEGLYKWNADSDLFEEVIYLSENYYDKNVFNIKSIYEDHAGNLWLSTYGGLHRVSEKNGHFEYGHFFHDPLDRSGICSNDINHVLQAQNGDYWIATAHGLNKLQFQEGEAEFTYFGAEKGLPNDYIYSLFEDSEHQIWMSSNMGIICFDPTTGHFKNYVYGDGVLNNEFNVGAFHKTDKGKLLFGGISGVTAFYPKMIRENMHSPQVHITSVKRLGEEIYTFRDWIRDEKLKFGFGDNNISIEFVALDYTNPLKNRYSYKLKNKDKNWIELGNQKNVTFSELKPGDYSLMVRGANNNGIWSSDYAELHFSVTPPFWQRIEFISSVLFFLAVSIYLFYRKKVNDKVRYAIEVEKIRHSLSEKVRRKAAADFHDEMGHYLTRINVLTEILKQRLKGSSEDIGGVVRSIGEQSQKLYNGTRDFIWTINPDNNSVYELAIRLKDFGDELTLDTDLNFHVSGIDEDLKESILTSDFARHLVLIFKEAINNSVKHSEARNIELSFRKVGESNLPVVTLSDDGKGIEIDPAGYGNGIQNMKKRAGKIASELEISSNSPRGTLIRLSPKSYKELNKKTA